MCRLVLLLALRCSSWACAGAGGWISSTLGLHAIPRIQDTQVSESLPLLQQQMQAGAVSAVSSPCRQKQVELLKVSPEPCVQRCDSQSSFIFAIAVYVHSALHAGTAALHMHVSCGMLMHADGICSCVYWRAYTANWLFSCLYRASSGHALLHALHATHDAKSSASCSLCCCMTSYG
jgi:hypothetical protein